MKTESKHMDECKLNQFIQKYVDQGTEPTYEDVYNFAVADLQKQVESLKAEVYKKRGEARSDMRDEIILLQKENEKLQGKVEGYAKCMALALKHGIFIEKEYVKREIEKVITETEE